MSFPGYILKCEVCNAAEKPHVKPILSESEAHLLLHAIYIGEYNETNLPVNYYFKTVHELTDGLNQGFGHTDGREQGKLYKDLFANLYYFAAAKTYQTVKVLQPDESEKSSFAKYEKNKSSILADFIGVYMAAEKDTTIQTSKQAKKWTKLTYKSGQPVFLEYVTKRDSRVRPAHAVLDGVIRKKGDSFWATFYPPNGWLCRCTVKKYKDGEETDLADFDYKEAYSNVPPVFRNNAGMTGEVFTEKHPYFKAPQELKDKNFGLPKPHERE